MLNKIVNIYIYNILVNRDDRRDDKRENKEKEDVRIINYII